jgi:hypothetical protein
MALAAPAAPARAPLPVPLRLAPLKPAEDGGAPPGAGAATGTDADGALGMLPDEGGLAAPGATLPAPGITNGFLHDGHATRLPPALSGVCIDFLQWGQRMICGMEVSTLSSGNGPAAFQTPEKSGSVKIMRIARKYKGRLA